MRVFAVLGMGILCLAIRLPFSISIAHFVSETITCLISYSYDDALYNILALFICGSIDACLDFFCIATK